MSEKRSTLSIADRYLVKMPRALWNSWTVQRSVEQGYSASGWVYAAIRQIVQAASNVPLRVYKDGNFVPDHPISKLLAYPSKSISGQDFLELIVAWLQLCGRAPFRKIFNAQGQSQELQLISPDRIAPRPATDVADLVGSYEFDGQLSTEFTPENVCYLKLIDPKNPLNGIGPLQAAARAVDVDIEQQEWNKSAMQNRGVVDGVFTFKTNLQPNLATEIMQKIKLKFGSRGAVREPLVIGSDASYTRMGLTAVEMDFLESRKMNREEIYIIFNVPLVFVNSASMTYNNYTVALQILYASNIIPLLLDICTEMTFSFRNELQDGEVILPDTSNVEAMREQDANKFTNKFANAKSLWDMGVPMDAINDRLELGLNPFTGSDLPWGGYPPRPPVSMQPQPPAVREGIQLRELETRDIKKLLAERDRMADGPVQRMFESLLAQQRTAVEVALIQRKSVVDAINNTRDAWVEAVDGQVKELATHFSQSYVMDHRGKPVAPEVRATITQEIAKYLDAEAFTLMEVTRMLGTTADQVTQQVQDGLTNDKTPTEIMQAIYDIGTFSAARAFRLAHTLTGTAQSIGQLGSAVVAGATEKHWLTAGDNHVRDLHRDRGKVGYIPIDETWNNGPTPMRFPFDPNGEPEDRVNCRCALTFKRT